MSKLNWPKYSFLIVDDVRLCRLSVLGILQNLGCKNTYFASNGLEALNVLEDNSKPVDCVISDFKMPEMNGLQLLKSIRTGKNSIRRDLPVAMLTGFGDESLVGLAIQLDVNTFLLKPANKGTLVRRLENILEEDLTKESWLREPQEYEKIDVNTPVANLLDEKTPTSSPTDETPQPAEGEKVYRYDEIPENLVLSRDLCMKDGRVIYPSGTQLTSRHITRLKGLKDIGFWDGTCFSHSENEGKKTTSESAYSNMNDESQWTERDSQRTTLSRYGKLNIGATVSCFRCETLFPPSLELLRLHNRGELTSILCPDCSKRNMELLCAAVKLMIMKGGFPLTADQMIQAFQERDPQLTKGKDDPFQELREKYKEEPLQWNDIKFWIAEYFFVQNSKTNQLECMINNILSNPERVKLLGKEGLEAKHMAAKRALHTRK